MSRETLLDPNSWNSPVVGVLGGLGPAATAVFLDLLVRATDAHSDQDHLDAIVSQHSSTPDRTAGILVKGSPDPGPVLARDALMLERIGASLLVLPCNTAHHYVQRIEDAVSIPFVSIIEATVRAAIRDAGGSPCRIAVFATEGNVRSGVYDEALREAGAEPWYPGRALQERINALIYDQVKANRPVDHDLFDRCVQEAVDAGAGTAILGCTELSVIYDHGWRGDARMTDSLTELVIATITAAGRGIAPEFAAHNRAHTPED